MTLGAIAAAAGLNGPAAHTERAHRAHQGGTPFDQQLQTRKLQQMAQSGSAMGATASSGTSAVSVGASLTSDLLRSIASHIDSVFGSG